MSVMGDKIDELRKLIETAQPSRERRLALTKLDECELWLTRVFILVNSEKTPVYVYGNDLTADEFINRAAGLSMQQARSWGIRADIDRDVLVLVEVIQGVPHTFNSPVRSRMHIDECNEFEENVMALLHVDDKAALKSGVFYSWG